MHTFHKRKDKWQTQAAKTFKNTVKSAASDDKFVIQQQKPLWYLSNIKMEEHSKNLDNAGNTGLSIK